MAFPQSINQVVQIGVEVTPGTNVAANKLLQALSIEPSIKTEVNLFRPSGMKYPTLAAQGREWVEAKLSGQATYSEIVYPLCSVLCNVVPSDAGATGKLWTFKPAGTAADTIKTYSVEQGDATRAHEFSYGLVTAFGLKFDRSKVEISGSMLGQKLADGISLTATPTAIPLIPVLPTHLSIYLADTQAGLAGATALAGDFSGSWEITNRFGPVWTLDSSQPSWAGHVELEPRVTAKLMMAADAAGLGMLTQLRSGATKWLRLKWEGDTIETTHKYTLQIDMAGKVTDVSDFSDQDGVFAVEWTFAGAYDATWAGAFEVQVKNTIASL